MTSRKVAVKAAILGFGMAVILAIMAFYPTSASPWIFLGLCPPSIFAMGLEKAGLVGSLFWWFVIALMNAGLYAVVGWLIGWLATGLVGRSN